MARTRRTRRNQRRFVTAPLFAADAARGDSADATIGGAGGRRRRGVWERLIDTVISSPKKTVQRVRDHDDSNRIMDQNDHDHETTILKTTPQWRVQLLTLTRVGLPSLLAGVIATLTFPAMALFLAGVWNTNPGTMAILSQDSSQFVQNFLTVAGLLFSILVGQTCTFGTSCIHRCLLCLALAKGFTLFRYCCLFLSSFFYFSSIPDYFLYTQQESLYYALFQEVTEAKSLLEQVALVCQGRSMYQKCLSSIAKYVQSDLKCIQDDPAILLSARPVDDPLEAIMYMTSVGIPSSVYETVKSLRAARAQRLGALQRKLPGIHMGLLWTLAIIELMSFPLLGAGTQTIGGYNILTIEGILFGVMTAGIVLTLRVVAELWRPAGGAYNVDAALSTMVRGLERELQARMNGRLQVSSQSAPSGAWDNDDTSIRRQ
jgi:hypothetical protein